MEASSIVTLRQGDADFRKYLLGTFSSDYRALPIRSLHVSSNQESVTFQVLPREQCRPSSIWQVLWAAFRPWTLLISLGTLAVTLLTTLRYQIDVSAGVVALSFLSVLSLHFCANLLNDFYDHYKGVDRMSAKSGSRVIQRGWLSAQQVWRLSMACLAVAILCATPIFLHRPSLLLIVALLAGIGVLEYSSDRLGLKYHGLGEVVIFLLFGPILTWGLAIALTGHWVASAFWIGVILGLSAAQIYFMRNVQNMLSDCQVGAMTLATRVGFDGAKRLAFWFAILQIVLAESYGILTGHKIAAYVLGLVILIGQSFLLPNLLRARSSLSSELNGLQRAAWFYHAAVLMALLLCL